jgi:hypothetical protein
VFFFFLLLLLFRLVVFVIQFYIVPMRPLLFIPCLMILMSIIIQSVGIRLFYTYISLWTTCTNRSRFSGNSIGPTASSSFDSSKSCICGRISRQQFSPCREQYPSDRYPNQEPTSFRFRTWQCLEWNGTFKNFSNIRAYTRVETMLEMRIKN